jgi:uncharacterized protein YjbI with pentapeptide repeats
VQVKDAAFEQSSLAESKFQSSKIQNSDFSSTDLSRAIFERAQLDGARLTGCNLRFSFIVRCEIYGTTLDENDFTCTNFYGSSFAETSFEAAILVGAIIYESDLTNTHHLTSAQLENALGDGTTKLRPEIKRPAAWPSEEETLEQRRKAIEAARHSNPVYV